MKVRVRVWVLLALSVGCGNTHVFSYDAVRRQLAVGQPSSNRVVLLRTGVATKTQSVGDTPDPSNDDIPVTFSAVVTSTPNAPANGRVTFRASSGW